IVMSATLDAAQIGKHLDAPIVRSEGRLYPVEIEYLEKPSRLAEQVAAAVRRVTVPGTTGDVLVFLPGAAEIRQSIEPCEAPHRAIRLYGKLDFENRPDHHPPEIERADLAGLLLDLRAAGLDPWKLPWLDPPPPQALQAAADLLDKLQTRGDEKLYARFPVHP